uniref:AIG1-type G domain-containing protein n=1 Tax=Kalanchoe fedtschenkoi TaxID=63787 RepID=A0A7N0TB97_KALFE
MDSETVVAAGLDTTTTTATSPSDEGGVAEESGKLKSSAGSSSFRISNSAASISEEEEEGEGGFVSGEEEFDTASERPYVAEDGGLDKSSEEEDVAFAEPPESLRSIAKLSEDENDDEVELNTLGTGGDGAFGVEDAAGATKENGTGATSVVATVGDESRTELASSEKPVDADGVEKGKVGNGVEDAVKVPETSISSEVVSDHGIDNGNDDEVKVLETSNSSEVVSKHGIDNVEEVQIDVVKPVGEGLSEIDEVKSEHGNVEEVQTDVVKPVGEGLSEVGELKSTADGDSVLESINVDVNVAEPGMAIVEDVKPAVEASLGAEKPVEDSVATKVEGREVGDRVSDKQVEIPDDDKSVENVKLDVKEDQPVVVPPSNDDSTVANGLKVTSEGDVVVETVQVDLQEPGVVVVNGSKETTNKLEVEEKDVQLDRSLLTEESLRADTPSEGEAPMVGGEGDSVKEVTNVVDNEDEIKVSEIKGEEILINGRSTELEEDKPVTAKPENDAVIVDDLKFTTEGDSVVEAVHLDVSEPEVAVVKDSKEDEKPEAEVAESLVGNNVLDQTSVAANDAKAEEIHGVRDVSNADDDEKIETAAEQDGRTEEVDEVDLSARGYDASVTEDLDQEENADDEIQRFLEEARGMEGSASDEDTNEMIFGSSEAAERFMEELEQQSTGGSQSGAESSRDRSQIIDGQIVTDSDEEVDTDEEESGKELFDSAALAALLKAATGGGSDGGNVTLSSQDVSNLFSIERPAGLGSSLRARSAPRQAQPNLFSSSAIAARGESESNLSEGERKKLESIQQLRVKFLRLVHRLGQSSEDSIAAQVLYRLVLVAGRPSNQAFSLDAAKKTAQELESQGKDDINFSLNILVIGKSGVGKSATINSIFGENKAGINAFEPATTSVKEITGVVNGVHIRVFDTPGLKTSVMDQATNRKILASVKKATKKFPPDIVLYVDRLDSQTRDLNDLPLLRTITSSLGASIWRNAIVTLTHAASAPPDGPSGAPLSYEVLVAQRSHAVQQSIGQAVGDLRLMNPSLMNPVSLAENHPSCRKNRDGQKVLPNGQTWRPQLLMFCYSMKILSEASALHKQKDPFDHQKLFGFRVRAPPLPYLLSWLLQSRTHPKLSAEQGGDNGDSDIDLDGLSESEGEEEEDEYDQLPPFKPLRNAQLAKLNKEQLKAYYEEYDYRVKLLQKKQWKEELKRMKQMKKGKVPESEFLGDEADPENGAPAAVPVPMPDMVLPPSFDCDNPAYRYRFLEPSSQFLARPVLDNHGWDHDCGYDGVNVEQSLAIASRFPAAVTVQLTKDKKEFNVHLDSSVAAKHGENASTMAGFDIQNIGKKMAYIVRGETKFKNLKKNKTTAGFSVTFLGENVATGVKIEDQIPIGKRLVLVGSTGTVRSQNDAAYGANLEVKLREADFPIGQDQSSLGLSLVKWRGDLALGANLQSQFSIGRGSKVAVRLGLNNKNSGQITVRTSTSDQLQIALVGIIPVVIGIYKAIMSGVGDNYGSY